MSFFSKFLDSSGVLEISTLEEEYAQFFLDEEDIEVGFKMNEDTFIFTNKRLVLIENQKEQNYKLAYVSLPYNQIAYFSIEAKKTFDPNAIFKIWLTGQYQPSIEKEFNKSVDVYEVQKILARHIF